MTARKTGIVVLAIHLALVLSVAAKHELDLQTLPRAWAQVEWTMPMNGAGRYLMLRACPLDVPQTSSFTFPVRLVPVNGILTATAGKASDRVQVSRTTGTMRCVAESVEFYLPDGVSSPPKGSELWAEFSVPADESPRPIRLGRKQNGQFQELTH